jgi:cysteine desulfurase
VQYFDHNATYPLSAAAREAWLDAAVRFPANPSSPYRWGVRSDQAMTEARERVAAWLGCPSHSVVWTSGATESNNAWVAHLARKTRGSVLISGLEHPSVRIPADQWLADRCEILPVSREGLVSPDQIGERLQRGDVGAVVLMAANNETGVIQPWQQVLELCRESGVPFACDASQWVGKLPVSGLGSCDFVSACAHKFGGPVGVGFLKVPASFQPLLWGGPQEEGRRAGTENVAGILAMVAALEERQRLFQADLNALTSRQSIRDQWVEQLEAAIPGVEVLGRGVPRLWNTVSVLMPPAADCRRRWVVRLDRLGFAVSTGSACSSGKEVPSPVLASMGYPGHASDRMVRLSAGWETTPEAWDDLLNAFLQVATEFGLR